MNCLNFRRLLLLDPRELDEDLREHMAGCRACAQFAERTRELEAEIREAAQVPVPAGLAEEILSAVERPARRRTPLYALAAGVVLSVGIAIGVAIQRDDPLALAGIDFVIDEEVSAVINAQPADPRELYRVADALGITLPQQSGQLHYIGTCPFRGGLAHHVVLTTPTGKVTLLLLPDRELAEPERASARGLRSEIVPLRGGSVAIVANSDKSLSRATEVLVRS